MSSLFAKSDHAPDGRDDFDFFAGRWRVAHRRLRRRLVRDVQWAEFDGACENRPVVGGLGNVDDNFIDLPSGAYRAVTLRLFSPTTRQWSIRWVDGRDMALGTPLHGTFTRGVGTFFGDDVYNGQPIRIRFIWSDITARTAQWQQAFSTDGGATWEDNWTMRFSRLA
jgi:hypothetical protein